MLPTILTLVETPDLKEKPTEVNKTSTLMEISRPNIARDSAYRRDSMSLASAFDEDEIEFENGQPTYKGNHIFKCFKNRGNGLLFRIVNDDEFKWAFYNDMRDYNMTVTCVAGPHSHVKPLGTTTMTEKEDTKEKVLVVTVGPCETAMFLDGVLKGFKLSYEAQPILKKAKKSDDAKMESQKK
jgi:hypothetical protein